MYLKLVSDLHVEWGPTFSIATHYLDPETVLIMAGDIDNAAHYHETVERIIRSTNFLGYILIPGNHEYYGREFNAVQEYFNQLEEFFATSPEFDNVWFTATSGRVNIKDEVTFIYSPMWTDGGESEIARNVTEASLSDFRVIRDGKLLWTVSRMREEFFEFVEDLEAMLREVDTPKTVLVTHHLPTYKAIAPEFKNSAANGGFAVDLIKYVNPDLLSKVDVMCFGHTHTCINKKVTIGDKKVQLLCNPRGYPKVQLVGMDPIFENNGFNPDFLFNLDTMRTKKVLR